MLLVLDFNVLTQSHSLLQFLNNYDSSQMLSIPQGFGNTSRSISGEFNTTNAITELAQGFSEKGTGWTTV